MATSRSKSSCISTINSRCGWTNCARLTTMHRRAIRKNTPNKWEDTKKNRLKKKKFNLSNVITNISLCIKIFYEEILKRSPRRDLLNEYACHLVKYHPHLKEDVLTKLHFLNRQWRSIEFSIMSKHYFNQDISKGMLEEWIELNKER